MRLSCTCLFRTTQHTIPLKYGRFVSFFFPSNTCYLRTLEIEVDIKTNDILEEEEDETLAAIQEPKPRPLLSWVFIVLFLVLTLLCILLALLFGSNILGISVPDVTPGRPTVGDKAFSGWYNFLCISCWQ